MVRISLINMPFSDIRIPSIALTQLKAVLLNHYGSKVQVDIHYFNLEIAEFLGPEVYDFISNSGTSNDTGFGDWFFRQIAFPELQDNTKEYFQRYGLHFTEDVLFMYNQVIKYKREELGQFLDQLILQNGLYEADIVGLTSMFMQNVPSFALAKRLKQANSDITIVMGGANCESPMGEEIVKNVEYVDYVFSGMALKSFPAFIQGFLNNDKESLNNINGVFSKANCAPMPFTDGVTTERKLRPAGDELPIDEEIELDYDNFLTLYRQKFNDPEKEPYILFETSRGCWWGAKAHCTFCGLNGGNMFYRAVNPTRAVELFNSLFRKYGEKVNHFSCVDNIIPTEYLTEVFPKLDVPKNITMFYEVKANLSEEDMQVLSNAQILEIQPGIESLATSTLKLMKKGTTAFTNVRFLKYCITYGIAPAWNLLIGFPGEEEDVYAKYVADLSMLFHLPPPSGVFPVRFDRYSPYFTSAKEYNLDLHPLDYYKLIYPFSGESLARMAYYFSDHNYDAEYIRITGKWINKLEDVVGSWQARWQYSEHHVRPMLYIYSDQGQEVIYDSRSGNVVEYQLSETGKEILESLSKHKNKTALFKELKHFSAEALEDELELLKDRKLIFEEKGSMLSLVFKSKPSSFKIEAYHGSASFNDEVLA